MSEMNLSWDEAAALMQTKLAEMQQAMASFDAARQVVQTYQDRATAEIARVLRAAGARNLNLDAIRATPGHPYTLLPSGKANEWLMVQYRGVETPSFGMLERQDDVFNVFRLTRAMHYLGMPFPAYIAADLDLRPPPFTAIVESGHTGVRLTEGDEREFRRKYGQYFGGKQGDSFKIQPGDAWLKLIAALASDGIYPWQKQPVTSEYWDPSGIAIDPNPDAKGAPIALFDYQQPILDFWLEHGAGVNTLPMGGGKGYLVYFILGKFRGRVMIASDSTTSLDHWRYSLQASVPHAIKDITLTTYQGAGKYLKEPFDLLIANEAHRQPAPTFSKLAYLETKYRLGDTGTPWRNVNQDLIFALLGPPIPVKSWQQLMDAGVMKRVPVIVDIVGGEDDKVAMVKQILGERKGGRALIYCNSIEKGNALSIALGGVPFVHGKTRGDKLAIILSTDVCILSRVGDTSLDIHDLSRVIDYDYWGDSMVESGQRWGRGEHSKRKDVEYHVITSHEQMDKQPKRLWGILSQLGERDIEYRDHTVSRKAGGRGRESVKGDLIPVRERASVPRAQPAPVKVKAAKPRSEIEILLENSAVRRALEAAYATVSKQVAQEKKIHAVLKLGWDAPVALEDLRIGMGLKRMSLENYKIAFAAAVKADLMVKVGDGYSTNKAKLNNLVKLSERFGR